MDIQQLVNPPAEKPLDCLVANGGFCGIFRTIACVGDSLSSGELESMMQGEKGWHDYFDYSWGQFLARDAGCKVYNFSRGGMTAKEYCESFAEAMDYWNVEQRCRAYILALGVNDVTRILAGEQTLGSLTDIDAADWHNNGKTFAGYYAQIIQRYQAIQPKAKFFLMTMPKEAELEPERVALYDRHAELLHHIAALLPNCYVLDFRRYAPPYDETFMENFYLGGHLSVAGYRLTALMVESYIDYIIRHHMQAFKQTGFVGTPFYNETAEW